MLGKIDVCGDKYVFEIVQIEADDEYVVDRIQVDGLILTSEFVRRLVRCFRTQIEEELKRLRERG